MTHIIHHKKRHRLPSPRLINTLIIIGMVAFVLCAALATTRSIEAVRMQAMEDRV